jgi:hypothetical protein
MIDWLRRRVLAGGLVAACVASAWAASPPESTLAKALAAVAPALDREVLQMAVSAMQCATAGGASPARHLAVIDYSLPSSQSRLWVFDLQARTLVYRERVAHGRNSGEHLATRFSNQPDSHQSSLGLFRTDQAYFGRNGYSLRLDGLEPGINDRARERAIVVHGAPYVDAQWAARHGRIGRSHGCPAVRSGVARNLIDLLKNGQFVFSYYPDRAWLASSTYLNCAARPVTAGSPPGSPDSG